MGGAYFLDFSQLSLVQFIKSLALYDKHNKECKNVKN